MPHILKRLPGKTLEDSYIGKAYTNDRGNAECVETRQMGAYVPPGKSNDANAFSVIEW
jgi:hypothetical protein